MADSRFSAAALVLTLFAGQSTQSPVDSTATTAGPVEIDRFSIASSAGKFPQPTVFLSFRNMSAKVADEVRFLVRYPGGTLTIVDKGVFSPRIFIRHHFAAPSGALAHGDAPASAVQYVHFSDGTYWNGL